MRRMFLALWLSVSLYAACAQLLQAQTVSSNNIDATAKDCQPTVPGVLLSVGWAYATNAPISAYRPRPCPDNAQQTRRNTQTQEADPAPTPNRLANLPAAEALRQARLLYLRGRSSWFNQEKLERELLKRKEFGELGLELTRSPTNADLILEITRKTFTTRFTCSMIEPYTHRIVAGTTASSLGGEIEPHLAEAIIKQFKAARSAPQKKEE